MIKITVERPCTETHKHYVTTDEKESHYWCIMCAKPLNKDGSEMQNE